MQESGKEDSKRIHADAFVQPGANAKTRVGESEKKRVKKKKRNEKEVSIDWKILESDFCANFSECFLNKAQCQHAAAAVVIVAAAVCYYYAFSSLQQIAIDLTAESISDKKLAFINISNIYNNTIGSH